jgi:hypothetical protein
LGGWLVCWLVDGLVGRMVICLVGQLDVHQMVGRSVG